MIKWLYKLQWRFCIWLNKILSGKAEPKYLSGRKHDKDN
jgi:hypothetical protein